MHKKNRTRMLVLSFIAFMLVLAGCGGSNANKANEGASTKDSNVAENRGDKTGQDKIGDSKPEPLTLTWMRYEHPNQPLKEDAVIIGEMKKRQNVEIKLQSVPQSNYEDKKKTLIATNTIPDVMLVKQDEITNFADSGIFLELSQYMDLMPNFKKVMEEKPEINKNKIDGKLYGFPLVQKLAASQSGQVPVIRVDLLEELNLDVPTTYEELYEVLKKFKQAYPKSFPFTSRAANGLTGTENLVNPIAFGFGSGYTNVNGAKVYYDPHEGEYKFGPFSSEFKQAIEYLHKLYGEKILDPDYTTATTQIYREKLSSGKSFYYQDNTGMGSQFNVAIQEINPKAQFDLIPILAGPNGVRRAEMYQLDHLSESYVISSKVKNPEAVVKFMDWLYSEEGSRLTSWGLENEHYTLVNGQYQVNEAFDSQFKDAQFRAKDSELGTGYLGLSLYDDDSYGAATQLDDIKEWTAKNYKAIEEGLAFRMPGDPSFSPDERERLKQLRTQLDAYLAQTLDTFIMTKTNQDDWDKFIKQCEDKGAMEIVNIYNTALARSK